MYEMKQKFQLFTHILNENLVVSTAIFNIPLNECLLFR